MRKLTTKEMIQLMGLAALAEASEETADIFRGKLQPFKDQILAFGEEQTEEEIAEELLALIDGLIAAPAASVPVQAVTLTPVEIEQGWRDTFSTNNPFCPCDLGAFTKAVKWAERRLLAGSAKTETPKQKLRGCSNCKHQDAEPDDVCRTCFDDPKSAFPALLNWQERAKTGEAE